MVPPPLTPAPRTPVLVPPEVWRPPQAHVLSHAERRQARPARLRLPPLPPQPLGGPPPRPAPLLRPRPPSRPRRRRGPRVRAPPSPSPRPPHHPAGEAATPPPCVGRTDPSPPDAANTFGDSSVGVSTPPSTTGAPTASTGTPPTTATSAACKGLCPASFPVDSQVTTADGGNARHSITFNDARSARFPAIHAVRVAGDCSGASTTPPTARTAPAAAAVARSPAPGGPVRAQQRRVISRPPWRRPFASGDRPAFAAVDAAAGGNRCRPHRHAAARSTRPPTPSSPARCGG